MTLVSSNDPHQPGMKLARLAADLCLGCRLCVPVCPKDSVTLKSQSEKVITPVNGAHRAVMMAIERGKLQYWIFANQVLGDHRALVAVLGSILRRAAVTQATPAVR